MSATGPAPAPDRCDTSSSAGSAGGEWFATVWADRDYHDLVRARHPADASAGDDVDFPVDHEPWQVALRGGEVRLGRRGSSAVPATETADVPQIDLAGPPRDPGVSHRHAVLLALPGDRWVVIDVGSTNGTTVNYAQEPLAPDAPHPLEPGDRIHLGAWTTVTVARR